MFQQITHKSFLKQNKSLSLPEKQFSYGNTAYNLNDVS